MYYIPLSDNGAYFPGNGQEPFRILPFGTYVLKTCMDPAVADETLTGYFPGRTFYGNFLDVASASEIRQSLNLLRAVKNAHELLRGGSELYKEEDAVAEALANQIMDIMNEADGMDISIGKGYCPELNPEDTIPQCHILTCTLSLKKNYFRWLKTRIEAYKGAAESFTLESVYYLNVANNITVADTENGGSVVLNIYGVQSLNTEWMDWLNTYEENLPWPGPSGLEIVAGILHLADTLSTIHLITAAPIVNHGFYCRPTAGDSLTNFWLKLYDVSGDGALAIGHCEVCGRLFIGTSKNKRGHEDCLNRQRVKLSRARKYLRFIQEGLSPQEAGKQASIAPETAMKILKRLEPDDVERSEMHQGAAGGQTRFRR